MIGVPLIEHARHVLQAVIEHGLIRAEGGKLVAVDGAAERLHELMREWRRERDRQLIKNARETARNRCRRAKRFHHRGMAVEAIANELGVVPATVRLMLRSRSGYYWQHNSREGMRKVDPDKAYHLHVTQGMTMRATGKALGISLATVQRYVKEERKRRERGVRR